jgi:hypothetical protein
MKRSTKGIAGLAMTAAAVLASTLTAAAPAHAGPSQCVAYPPAGQHGGNPASVTCPAGAGTFEFRVAATCADGYPNLHLFPQNGPWVRASASSQTVSATTCNGYVPGSGFVWDATIEVR